MDEARSTDGTSAKEGSRALIDFQAVTVDPIKGFYGAIGPRLPELVDSYLASLREGERGFSSAQADMGAQIAENERQVREKFALDRIAHRRMQNG